MCFSSTHHFLQECGNQNWEKRYSNEWRWAEGETNEKTWGKYMGRHLRRTSAWSNQFDKNKGLQSSVLSYPYCHVHMYTVIPFCRNPRQYDMEFQKHPLVCSQTFVCGWRQSTITVEPWVFSRWVILQVGPLSFSLPPVNYVCTFDHIIWIWVIWGVDSIGRLGYERAFF